MCGIVGYVGGRPAVDVIIDSLGRLEYRGYDSAGLAVVSAGEMTTVKRPGKLLKLEKALANEPVSPSTTGIGHTRWATHGAPTEANAHPHLGPRGRVAVVHNGIIENHRDLRAQLDTRALLLSETDTEVAAHLLEREVEDGAELTTAMARVCRRLEGAFTLVAVDADDPTRVVAAQRSSPLVVGLGNGENFLGSDVAAFIDHTREALELGQDQVVTITRDSVQVTDFDGRPASGRRFRVDWDLATAERDGFDWFMRKEIFEQPGAVASTLRGRRAPEGGLVLDEMGLSDHALRDVDRVVILACGTSYYAGMAARLAIEEWAEIPCEVEIASEYRHRAPRLTRATLVVAISQSGETADTLMAVRHARRQGARILTVCNSFGSSLARGSDAVLYTHAGPEIGVASTKGFLTQLVACYLLALYLAQVKGTRSAEEVATLSSALEQLPAQVQSVLDESAQVLQLARRHATASTVLFLGRHAGHPVALEGALKLKELAYIHAEGFAAGELKHGPIALVEPGVPVICIVPPPAEELHAKVLTAIQEVRARGAHAICLAAVDDSVVAEYADELVRLPAVPALLQPVVAVVPLQLFACELASHRGHDVDQPRNLAKSVTVE